MVLEAAVAGHCTHIVTFNRKDFEGVDEFGITEVTPQQFLDIIGGKE
ncbi:MAG: PIN domain-containing protein [Kiritimatiellae bacterium]|nr:PIN domain-containing protein [Kiritimatiellia bacterium]